MSSSWDVYLSRFGLGGVLGLAGMGLSYLVFRLLRRYCSQNGNRAKLPPPPPVNAYETDTLVNQYMAFHYAEKEKYFAYDFGPKQHLDFPLRCAELCKKHMNPDVLSRVLDMGCAVGRSSFELARDFQEVLGIDFSQAFIDKCNELKEKKQCLFAIPGEGELTERGMAVIPEEVDCKRITFEQGDACTMRQDIGQFGCVLAANLICRLPSPLAFLDRLPDIVVPGGIVVFTSPYSWLDEYTPKYLWLGGFCSPEGEPVSGFDSLKEIMSPFFDLIEEKDMPFVIRETQRKHQWTVAHATVWKRKGLEKSKDD